MRIRRSSHTEYRTHNGCRHDPAAAAADFANLKTPELKAHAPGSVWRNRRAGFAGLLAASAMVCFTGFGPLSLGGAPVLPDLLNFQGLLSSQAAAAPPAATSGRQAPRQADVFVREDLASNAVRLEARLQKEAGAGAQRPAAQSRAMADGALARQQFGQALGAARDAIAADGKDAAAWMLYSRAASAAAPATRTDTYRLRNEAVTAAYAAYQAAAQPAQKATYLAGLGAALAAVKSWRPALNAYAASLALVDAPDVRNAWRELREKYGFRITDYKVDSDAASPRVCFNFSEPLARGRVDFAPFVALAGAANAAVTAEGQQLCVDGLKHGQSYGMVLRQGLPSSVGEDLLANADYQIYVRDRSPMARFTGRNYVLPRTGQEGIPVVTVNTAAVRIELARIGDRSLLPTVRSDSFMSQLSRYGVDEVLTKTGSKVWSGDLEVKSAALNADVITAFPVQEATGGKLEPGVYVMTAQPAASVPLGRDEDYNTRATQWFVVSDFGLTAVSTESGVRGVLRSLATAKPLSGVEVRLVARNNDVLATLNSDASGVVAFDPGLARGKGGMAPGMLVASDSSGDYGFLDLEQSAFDLSDRGVKGREAPGPMDAFLFTERGVYRSGETVFLTALLRTNKSEAAGAMPMTLVVRRPDGVEYRRAVVDDQGLGGRAMSIPLLSSAQSGTWRVKAYVDPKGEPVGEVTFLVEDYVPERLEITLKPVEPALQPGQPAAIRVDARYLYGAPGSGLAVTGEVGIAQAPASAVKGLEGYQVGLDDESFEAVTAELEEPVKTDGAGQAIVQAPIADVAAARPLQATVTLRVGEEGGRAVSRAVTLPILPAGPVIGVKRLFGDLAPGANASFDVVMARPDGGRMGRSLKWSLYKVERRYQWFNNDGRWNSEPVKSSRRTADGVVEAGPGAPARIAAPVDWGSWRLEVVSEGEGATVTSVSFNVGFGVEAGADKPDALDVKLNKTAYTAGDVMEARIDARFNGTATLMIVTDRVQHEQAVSLESGGATVKIPVKADWGAGAYAVAFAHRPLDVAAKRMPGRAIGVAWFSVDRDQRQIGVSLTPPAQMRPRAALSVPVALTGLKPGEDAYITVAAVDVGILNLTRYEPPRPQEYFLGQRQLGAELRDLYGYLIDGMQGARGALRSGGDGAAMMQGEAPSQEPLARFSGVVKVGPDGKAMVNFDIPAFNGTVRVMATAWSAGRVGGASTDVIVRDPVVATATAPRFMAIGDRSRLHVQVDNVDADAGEFAVNVDLNGPGMAPAEALARKLTLAKGGKAAFDIPLTATGKGVISLAIQVNGKDVDAVQSVSVRAQPGLPALARRTIRPLQPGASIELTNALLADLVPGTGMVALAATQSVALDAPALLRALDLYPYGCTEQVVSRALPLLYSNQLAAVNALPQDSDADRRINDAIARVMSRQDSNGSFGLWSVGGDDVWLDAYVADFLTRARERGFSVLQQPFELALERLRNTVANAGDFDGSRSDGIAYAIYVLARNGRPVMGDLRYLADTKLASFPSALARAQVAAALALLGDRPRAERAFNSAVDGLQKEATGVWRPDFGSRLRDGAAIMSLAVEAGVGGGVVQQAGVVVEQARANVSHTSTQENVWLLLAAIAMEKETRKLRFSFNGEESSGALFRNLGAAALATPARIANIGSEPAQLVVTTSGNPLTPEPEQSRGYAVQRAYYKLDGTKIDATTLRQNDRLVVMLRITEQAAENARLLVVDHLPAGVEIENPKLVDGASLTAFAWADKDQVAPTATEYRDDRFVAAYERRKGQSAFINVGYIVRVVSPGRFIHPPATAEDMYRPDRFGRSASGVISVDAAQKP